MITTIQEGDGVTIQLIHSLGDTDGWIDEAIVIRSDTIGVVVEVEISLGKDKEGKYQRAKSHVFVPWSNVMAAHVLREGIESDGHGYETLNSVIGDHPEIKGGYVVSKEEKRHRQLLEAQDSVTFFNGDL